MCCFVPFFLPCYAGWVGRQGLLLKLADVWAAHAEQLGALEVSLSLLVPAQRKCDRPSTTAPPSQSPRPLLLDWLLKRRNKKKKEDHRISSRVWLHYLCCRQQTFVILLLGSIRCFLIHRPPLTHKSLFAGRASWMAGSPCHPMRTCSHTSTGSLWVSSLFFFLFLFFVPFSFFLLLIFLLPFFIILSLFKMKSKTCLLLSLL